MDAFLLIASEEAGFFDKEFLYVAGGLLVVFALTVTFLGLRRGEDFPTRSQLRGLGAVAVVLVAATGVGAVQNARFEQSERRAENEEAAKEAQGEETTKEEAEAPQTEGEAASPGTATGEPSGSPGAENGGAGGGASAAGGAQLFVDAGCGGCHTLADAGTNGSIGPVLDDVLADKDAAFIRTSIVDPGAQVAEGFPAGTMPSNYEETLTQEEIDTLVAYLDQVTGQS